MVKVLGVLAVIVVVIVLLMTPAVQNIIAETLFSPFEEKVPETAVFKLTREFQVSANGGIITNFTLDTPALKSHSPGGTVLQQVLNTSEQPSASSEGSRYGVPWLVWQYGNLEGSQTYNVQMNYEVRVNAHVWKIDAASSANLSDIPYPLKGAYLHDEWKIVVDNPAIEARSTALVGQEKDVYTILYSIYHWVVDNVRYPANPRLGDPASSVDTLASKVGDCDDQSILFCALARAAGIPAWMQLGALYDPADGSWNGHGWVQTFIPLVGGGGEYVIIDTVNRDFLVYKPNRIVEYTDDGNEAHLHDYYYSFTYSYVTDSYSPGQTPDYSETFTSISYQPSSTKVSIGSIFS
jgi:hypothetical protein